MRKRETPKGAKGAKAPKHAKAEQPTTTPKAEQPTDIPQAECSTKTSKTAKAREASKAPDPTDKDPEPIATPANISLLYESCDGMLCLFQDGDGHLTAVRTDRLA